MALISLEQVTQAVWSRLEQQWPSSAPYFGDLANLCTDLTDQALALAEEVLTDILKYFGERDRYPVEFGESGLFIDNVLHQLTIAPSAEVIGVIECHLRATVKQKSSFVRRALKVPLDSSTPWEELRLRTEARFQPDQEIMASYIRATIVAAFRWLETRVGKEVSAIRTEVIEEAYRIVRRAVPREVADQIWLFFISKEQGIWIFDDIAQASLLRAARSRSSEFSHSPAETLSALATTPLEPDTSMSGGVIAPGNLTLPFDTLDIPSSRTRLGIAQYIAFDGQRMVLQSLIGSEAGDLSYRTAWLTAQYAESIRGLVETPLKSIRSEVRELFKNHARALIKMEKKIRSTLPRSAVADWGTFIGKACGEILKSLAQP